MAHSSLCTVHGRNPTGTRNIRNVFGIQPALRAPCVLQVRDTCCGDKTDEAQCQIACEKFLANTPSINRHAVDQEIVDLCSSASSPVPRHRCSNNATGRSSNRHKCKSVISGDSGDSGVVMMFFRGWRGVDS